MAVRSLMSANNTRPSRHRDQDAAISAVAHVGASSTQGHSPGVHMHIDADPAFFTLSAADGAAIIRACGKARNETVWEPQRQSMEQQALQEDTR